MSDLPPLTPKKEVPQKDFIIDSNQADQRFDRWCRKVFANHPEVKLGQIYRWVRQGLIKVNMRKTSEEYRIKLDDVVTMFGRGEDNPLIFLGGKQAKIQQVSPDKFKSMIVAEDDNRVVRSKPADVVMHGWNDHHDDINMHDYLQAYLGGVMGKDIVRDDDKGLKTFTPSFGYRLDKDTSGVLVAAKNYPALQYLNEVIRDREVNKTYYAVVGGIAPQHMVIEEPLFRGFNKKYGRAQMFVNHEMGIEAKTELWLDKTITHKDLGDISLIRVKLYTGRMHQIRVHLGRAGYPILGDMMYGDEILNKKAETKCGITRQLLHASEYRFWDPFGKKEFVAKVPVPREMMDLFKIDQSK